MTYAKSSMHSIRSGVRRKATRLASSSISLVGANSLRPCSYKPVQCRTDLDAAETVPTSSESRAAAIAPATRCSMSGRHDNMCISAVGRLTPELRVSLKKRTNPSHSSSSLASSTGKTALHTNVPISRTVASTSPIPRLTVLADVDRYFLCATHQRWPASHISSASSRDHSTSPYNSLGNLNGGAVAADALWNGRLPITIPSRGSLEASTLAISFNAEPSLTVLGLGSVNKKAEWKRRMTFRQSSSVPRHITPSSRFTSRLRIIPDANARISRSVAAIAATGSGSFVLSNSQSTQSTICFDVALSFFTRRTRSVGKPCMSQNRRSHFFVASPGA